MNIRGVDVSIYQPNIDWAKVAASGIRFALIKAGGSECGRFEDRTFRYNYEKARANGIKLGAYDKWVARCGSEPQYVKAYQVWQYSSSGSVPGINGRVDVNISNTDYDGGEVQENYFFFGENFAPVFDPDYYANRYPDLEGAFGYDHAALWNHFTTYGMNELRQASAEFNPKIYIEKYEDLRKAYGDLFPLYYWHYCHFGKAEGRTAS